MKKRMICRKNGSKFFFKEESGLGYPFSTLVLNAHNKNLFYMSKYQSLISPLLSDVNNQYPNFPVWYSKVAYELLFGFRTFILILCENNVAAFSILKHSKEENKICTLLTSKKFRNIGLGAWLMRMSLSQFDGQNISLTMPEKKVEEFTQIINKNNFFLEKKILNFYNRDEIEFFYTRCGSQLFFTEQDNYNVYE